MKVLPEVQELLDSLKDRQFNDPISAWTTEVMALHANRLVRKLKASRVNGPKIIEAVMENTAARSRITELMLIATVKAAKLTTMIEAATDLIWTVQGTYLTNNFRTRLEKDKAIRTLLAPARKRRKRYDTFIEMAELAVKDLDATGWSLKNTIDALNLQTKREITV